jgi:PEP-CTERM motif
MRKYLCTAPLLLVGVASTPALAGAGLTASVISGSYDYPDQGTPYPSSSYSTNPFIVSNTIETTLSVGGILTEVNFNDDSLILTAESEVFYAVASFNGPVFSVVSGNPFAAITRVVFPSRQGGSAFLSGGALYVNWAGDQFIKGDTVTVDFASVPEPSTWATFLMGFAGVGFASWRVFRKRAAFSA